MPTVADRGRFRRRATQGSEPWFLLSAVLAPQRFDEGGQRREVLRVHVIEFDAEALAIETDQERIAAKRRESGELERDSVTCADFQLRVGVEFEQGAVQREVEDPAFDLRCAWPLQSIFPGGGK